MTESEDSDSGFRYKVEKQIEKYKDNLNNTASEQGPDILMPEIGNYASDNMNTLDNRHAEELSFSYLNNDNDKCKARMNLLQPFDSHYTKNIFNMTS